MAAPVTQSPEQFSCYSNAGMCVGDSGCEDGIGKWSLAGERNEGRSSKSQVGHIVFVPCKKKQKQKNTQDALLLLLFKQYHYKYSSVVL